MLRSILLASLVPGLVAGLPAAAPGQAVLSAEGMAGIGVQGCESISGAENAPVLAAAVDWGLGYLAGRRDGGNRPVEGEPLSTTDPADLATGLVLYCRENPYGLVLDALRAYGLRVFAEGPQADPSSGPRLPRIRPLPRPEDTPVAEATGSGSGAADRMATRAPMAGPAVAARAGSAAIALPAAAIGGASALAASAAAVRRAVAEPAPVLVATGLGAPAGAAPSRDDGAVLASRAGGARDVRIIGVGVGTGPVPPEASPWPHPRP